MTRPASARDGLIQSAIGFFSRAAIQLCMLAVTVLAIRSLAIADFGAYAIAAAFMFLFRRLFYVGPYEYMLQTPEHPTLNGSCLTANAVFAVGSTLAVILISLASTLIFGTALVGDLLLVMAPALFVTMLTSWFEARMLKRQLVTRYYIYTVVGEAVGAIAAIWALYDGFGVYSLVFQTYVRLTVLLLCYWGSVGDNMLDGNDVSEAMRIIRWSRTRYATVFVNFFSVYGSDIMLGALLSPVATGIFRAGNRIVSALTDLFAQPLQKIAQTNLSARTAQGLPLDQSWLSMFSAVAAIGWAALAGLACVAHDLVPAILGKQWTEAAPIVVVMCVVRGLPILDATTVSMLVCGLRRRFILNVQIATAICVVAGAATFAPRGPLVVAFVLGLILCGQSVMLCWACCRMSAVQAGELVAALVVALVPAACVVLAVKLMPILLAEPHSQWLALAEQLIAASLGSFIGLAIVRGDLLKAAHFLAPSRSVEVQNSIT
jgi:O-antigen/teichoic acid export membrane protein